MKALEHYFHGEFGAARAYLFAKLFLVMTALDTWMLMIGHSGRYGVADFNVAHFEWLDRLQPIPTADFYIAVLVLTGLLALVIALTRVQRELLGLLFLLYTFSWSMSMLDSYQHHYFMSLIMLCLVFFPETTAAEINAHHAIEMADEKRQRKKSHELDRVRAARTRGWTYIGTVLACIALYALFGVGGGAWPVAAVVAAVAAATWLYDRSALPEPARASGFGFPLLGVTVVILYVYTAIAKMDANWVDGHTMRQLSNAEMAFAGLADYAVRLGMEREAFWSLLATSVIPLECLLAAGYLLGVHQDRLDRAWARVLSTVVFILAVMLHAGNELMDLKIGWFSYYMFGLAAVFLLPLSVVEKLAMVVTWPAALAGRQLDGFIREGAGASARMGNIVIALAGTFVLLSVGHLLDLPGTLGACAIAAAALVAGTLWLVVRGHGPTARTYILATGLSGAMMWGAIAVSDTRWNFYRYLGGDLARRGEPEAALEAYLEGERFAPEGQTRRDKIEQLKRQLGK